MSRSKRNNIDTNEKIIWGLRGKRRNIEKLRRIVGSRAKWIRKNIRDEEIDLIDAIDTSSRLRSKIGFHNFSKSNSSKYLEDFSIFEVTNTQHLARRLILEKFGIWEEIKKSRVRI